MNDALIFLRQVRLARQLLDVVAVRLSARYSPGGSMRLLEKACVGQVGHDIADGRGTQSLTIATRQGARSYRLARGYEGFHDRRKNLTFAFADWLAGLHSFYREEAIRLKHSKIIA